MLRDERLIKREELNGNIYKVVYTEGRRMDDKYEVQYRIVKITKEGVKSNIFINDYIIPNTNKDKKILKRKIMSKFHKLMTGLKGENYYENKITLQKM